jgi:voltage-gated potassium channel
MSTTPATTAAGLRSAKERYRSFIDRHEVAWELSFAGLAVLFVSLAFVPAEPGSSEEATLYAIEWIITGIFIIEFGSRLWAAQSRVAYTRSHIVDLISCIPPARWLRWFRLLRLLRLIRAFAGVGRAMTHVDRLARHRGLLWLIVAWSAVMVLCSIGLYAAENGVNSAIASPLDALWWGITTMTTVGYGDVIPVTAEGRIAAGILMLLGIGLYSAITATVTSFLLSGDHADVADQIERLASLHADGRLTDEEFRMAKAKLIGPSVELSTS